MKRDEKKSSFHSLLETLAGKKIYFDELPGGNNGDTIILMSAKHILQKTGCKLVGSPCDAEQIVVHEGGKLGCDS